MKPVNIFFFISQFFLIIVLVMPRSYRAFFYGDAPVVLGYEKYERLVFGRYFLKVCHFGR